MKPDQERLSEQEVREIAEDVLANPKWRGEVCGSNFCLAPTTHLLAREWLSLARQLTEAERRIAELERETAWLREAGAGLQLRDRNLELAERYREALERIAGRGRATGCEACVVEVEALDTGDSTFPDPPFTLTAWGCGCNVVEGEVTHACRKGKKCLRLHPEPDADYYIASMQAMVTKILQEAGSGEEAGGE